VAVIEETPVTSINKRYVVSLSTNIIRSGISFSTSLLLARWLGPEDFGRMAFLLATFMAFKQLLDMGSSYAFFTFLSQRDRSRHFVNIFWKWIALQLIVSLSVVWVFLPDSILNSVWQGESRSLVVLALIATFMQQNVWPIASQMAEARRETVRVQLLNLFVVIFNLFVVVALWAVGKLVIPLIFVAMILEWSIAGWLAAQMYQVGKIQPEQTKTSSDRDDLSSIFKEFWKYCKPWIPVAWLGFTYEMVDRWMLQHWGGASEQAYFAISQQFAGVALLATTSILRIFWKEIAEAKHQGNDEKVKQLYNKISKRLYFISAFVVGILLPWTSEIISLLLGVAYIDGSFTLMLMFLYPVHQSMGQIGAAMLLATENTRIQAKLSIFFMLVSLAVVYFMLAPVNMEIPGLGLASKGLAIKMVVIQLMHVNILAWFIAKIFGWRFEWFYQVVGLGSAIIAGLLAKLIVISILSTNLIVMMLLSGVVYLALIYGLLYTLPWIAGLTREDIAYVTNKIIGSSPLK